MGWVEDVGVRVPLRMTYRNQGVRRLSEGLRVFFTPTIAGLVHKMGHWAEQLVLGQYDSLYAQQRLQTTNFLTYLTCLNAIIAIESCRRGNSMTIASISFAFGLAMQLLGGGQIVPLSLFLQYITLPPSKYTLRSSGLLPTRYAKTLLLILVVGYIIPSLGVLSPTFSPDTKQTWNFA
ncbi:hypothetical protein F5882DRAFT_517665 [Hyaloscypha sp. PMI_1271]|nr:hypothetical protein F5882DRAFT_517665 [Hyaloscypha sp. PMI_1271]